MAGAATPLRLVLVVGATALAARTGSAFITPAPGASVSRGLAAPRRSTRSSASVASKARHEGPEGSSASFALTLAAAGAALLAKASTGRAQRSRLVARRANMVATRPDQAIPWWNRMVKPQVESGVGIWAEKLNMTTIFQEEEGNVRTVPATILVIKRGGNWVTAKKWPEKFGYYSVQVGYQRYTPKGWQLKGNRMIGIKDLAKNELPPLRKIREFRVRPDEWEKYEVGQRLWPSDLFKEGDLIDVHGKSKGKGMSGAIKKWGHKRGPMTHGSKHHRRYGSVGAGTSPGRVLPEKKMPGWAGDNKMAHTLKIMKIMDKIDEPNMPESIIVVKGTVPGYSAYWKEGGSYVYMHRRKNKADGRFKRDPVWLWYYKKGEGVDPYVPLRAKAWTWNTLWGRDMRWIAREVKKYWPDGFPGYDHSKDPFYDDCDPHKALKAPEW
ncbi:unnamed protein product [Polarella glacialis]|uniref:Large ribosomal subunit protein uL3c n=2 Tax=Polarella glacialis TaxID=89957 RepID=A0A813GSP7_POLGL|nr:unnamed protein product [Polarella glacialis]